MKQIQLKSRQELNQAFNQVIDRLESGEKAPELQVVSANGLVLGVLKSDYVDGRRKNTFTPAPGQLDLVPFMESLPAR